jgi:hypothetical protein
VAVGQFQNSQGGLAAAAWISSDWRTWTRTFLDRPLTGDSTIWRVLPLGSGLLAIGSSGVQHCLPPPGEGQVCDPLPLALWTSPDGQTWQAAARPAALAGVTIAAVAAGPGGLILVGDTGWNQPGIWTSGDGRHWQRQKLFATFAGAHFLGLTAGPAGWVLSGYRGGAKPVCCAVPPTNTTPAAWFSPDGKNWQAAPVAGAKPAPDSQVSRVLIGRDGLVALNLAGDSGWVSPDGRRWTVFPPSADASVAPWATDGTRIIGRSPGDHNQLNLWTSFDGVTWVALPPSGAVDQMPGWSAAGASAQHAFVFPGGLGLVGWIGTDRIPLWFALAVARP